MRRLFMFTLLLIAYSQGISQTNEEIFDWAKKNFRHQEDSVVSLLKRSKSTDDLYWFAKFDAFLAMIEMRNGYGLSAHARYSQSLLILRDIKSADTKLIYQILRNMASINMNYENYRGAISAYSDALLLAEPAQESQEQIDLTKYYLAKAMLNVEGYYQAGQDTLIKLYANRESSANVRATNLLGLNAQKIGDHGKAVRYFKEAIARDNKNYLEGNAEHNIANSYIKMNRPEDAISHFQTALSKMTKDSGRFVVMLDMGGFYLKQGQYSMASSILSQAIDNHWGFSDDKKYIKVFDLLGEAHGQQGSQVLALEARNKYRELRDKTELSQKEIARIESIRAIEFQAESVRLMEMYRQQNRELVWQKMFLIGVVLMCLLLGYCVYCKIKASRKAAEKIKRDLMFELQRIDQN